MVAIAPLTDSVLAAEVSYADEDRSAVMLPAQSGWLELKLSPRPVFVEEVGPRSRPDLVVDSVRVEPKEPQVGERMVIRAWVKNLRTTETRATPDGFPTKIAFLCEGDTLGYESVTQPIQVGQSVRVEFVLSEVEPSREGPNLIAVTANPGQRFVELDMDNNTCYGHAVVRP